jgi:hypothetical protein
MSYLAIKIQASLLVSSKAWMMQVREWSSWLIATLGAVFIVVDSPMAEYPLSSTGDEMRGQEWSKIVSIYEALPQLAIF